MKVRYKAALCCIEGGGLISGCSCSNPIHKYVYRETDHLLPGDEPAEGLTSVSNALASIAAERQRQIAKGWTAEHDDLHVDGEIATQAIHVLRGWNVRRPASVVQPSERTWVDPYKHTPRECLVIAAALVVAEIERIDRMTAAKQIGIEDWSE